MWETVALQIAAPYIALAAKALLAQNGQGPAVTEADVQAAHDTRHAAEDAISALADRIRGGGPPAGGKNA